MAPLAKILAAAAILAAPALATSTPKLEARQYQDPNSPLVMNEPACDFYRCYIFWVPGTQVAVNWVNPPQGDVQVDLMVNNNTEVAYNIGTAPSISQTCDAGAGYGKPGPNGAQCGGFVFTVPSSWNAGNYSGLRAMSIQNQDLQSYTDMIYITHNSSTSNNVALSIVSGSTIGSATSTAASSATRASTASAKTTSAGSAPTSSASRSSGSVSATSTSARPSSTSSSTPNGALSASISSTAVLSIGAVLAIGFGALL